MSALVFTRQSASLTLLTSDSKPVGDSFVAYNNVDSSSKGPWPSGTFAYVDHVLHSDISDPEQAYGLYGILIFLVPGRSGMGVHSGRQDVPDGLGRKGPAHATMGCIRTTDEAMLAILTCMKTDPMQSITVRTGDNLDMRIGSMLVLRAPTTSPAQKRTPQRRRK